MSESFVVGPVTDVSEDAAFAFHRDNLGDFILPLPRDTFRRIVEERQAIAVEQGGEIAGICYVKPDGKELDDVVRWEFGGLFLAPALRGLGLGALLSSVAIAAVARADGKPVMGYVHQDNQEGLGLLVRRLGFRMTGQTIRLGPDDAAGYLRRDSAGFAAANILRLPDAALARIADAVEHLDDGSRSRSGRIPVRLADGLFPAGPREAAQCLRVFAERSES
ncbi:GNAT family N-acetyltransferase [Amycolatopsis silviterrae]|uniref:GNAT family N-acetyltransferase n=1 Tax=Amycolatopsis silviterrae TaxID=1656914 RepID=A0ABW5HGP9_9PSEU